MCVYLINRERERERNFSTYLHILSQCAQLRHKRNWELLSRLRNVFGYLHPQLSSLGMSHTHTHSLSHSLTYTFTHTHTHTHTHSRTHTHTHIHKGTQICLESPNEWEPAILREEEGMMMRESAQEEGERRGYKYRHYRGMYIHACVCM